MKNKGKLTRIKELIERGETLDSEIRSLHKLAQTFSELDSPITLKFSYPKTSKSKDDILDSDGSLKNSNSQYGSVFSFYLLSPNEEKRDDKDEFKRVPVNSQTALACLGVIIQFKKDELKMILKELKNNETANN